MNLLDSMATFVDIVDTGSLTAAAERGGLSPAMVGNHLRALESRTGMTLLNRTTRRQSLTDFGRLYLQRCREILELVEDSEALALQASATPRGTLRITAPHAFGADWLMPALADYMRDYPEVDLDLVTDDRVFDLVEDEFEAALRIGALEDVDLIARALRPFCSVLCAAPDYLAARGEPTSLAALHEHDCLLYTYADRIRAGRGRTRIDLIGPDGPVFIDLAARVAVNSAAALLRAALSAQGIAFLPERVVADELANGQLQRVLPDYHSPERALHLVYRRDRRMSPKLRAFIDFVDARFGVSSA